jgi:hypothetical protein
VGGFCQLRGGGILERGISRKVVCFGGNSVEVVDYLGSSGGTQPVYRKAYIVNASLGRLAVVFGDAGECVPVSTVRLEGRWKEDVSFT